MIDFEWLVEDETRSIPTLASIRKWLAEDKLGSQAGQVCMKLCIKSVR